MQLSSAKRDWDEVLSLYRERDEVEKKFDDLKNELEAMPLRVHKIETLQGLLFIFFISLILRAMLLRRAREAELLDKKSIEDILMELSKLIWLLKRAEFRVCLAAIGCEANF